MKAEVQYNDYIGTVAVDGHEWDSLLNYLKAKGVDTEKFKPVGFEFYSGEGDFFYVGFICKDRDIQERKLVTIRFECPISKDEFFSIFKRFDVVATWAKGVDYSSWDLDRDPIYVDREE